MIVVNSVEDRHQAQLMAELRYDNAPTKTPSQLERGINAPSRDHKARFAGSGDPS